MKPRIAVEIAMAQEGDIGASIGVGADANAGMVQIGAMLGNQGGNSISGANTANDFAINEPIVMD